MPGKLAHIKKTVAKVFRKATRPAAGDAEADAGDVDKPLRDLAAKVGGLENARALHGLKVFNQALYKALGH